MDKIKERAKKYANDIATTEERGWMDRSDIYEIAKDAHIAGATEQRKIDIDKACDAYCQVCGHYPHTVPMHICRQDCDYYVKFRKAMED